MWQPEAIQEMLLEVRPVLTALTANIISENEFDGPARPCGHVGLFLCRRRFAWAAILP
jgi:hypothetical protein